MEQLFSTSGGERKEGGSPAPSEGDPAAETTCVLTDFGREVLKMYAVATAELSSDHHVRPAPGRPGRSRSRH